MKKTAIISIIATFLLASTSFASFIDTQGHQYEESINYIQDEGIVQGYSDGTYKPFQKINRAELMKVVLESNYSNFTDQSCFPDVQSGQWYSKYVCKGLQQGIVRGYSDGYFRPDREVSFVEALKIMLIAYGQPFEDPITGNWYDLAVRDAQENNLIPPDIYDYTQEIDRGQMAEMLTRLIKNLNPNPEPNQCVVKNSIGDDGDYWLCVNDTLTHNPSSLKVKVLSIDSSEIVLSLYNLPGGNSTQLTINRNSTASIGGNYGSEVVFKYLYYNEDQGAKIAISSTVPVIKPNIAKKFLTLITVVSTQQAFDSWGDWINFNENDDLQNFKVVIWDNSVSKKVSLYKFDRTFDPYQEQYFQGGFEWVSYRESFNILNIEILTASSEEYLSAFKEVFKKIVENQPAEHYGMKFLGHGNGNSALFEGKISTEDSSKLLAYFNSIIGKKIDFLDWNTNCNSGYYDLVKNEYMYADYILASDLVRGGYTLYSYVTQEAIMREHTRVLETFFSRDKSIREALMDMVDSERLFWVDALRQDMIDNKLQQSISLYETNKFEELRDVANLEQMPVGDVLLYIKSTYPNQEQKFYDFRFHYVSNKDFFEWDQNSNGFVKY